MSLECSVKMSGNVVKSPVPDCAMPTVPDLTDDEHAELMPLLRDAIANERYFLSPRMKRLKGLLAKLDPASAERAVTPLPAPKPAGEPSLLYRKLRGGGRRR
jgi:hypothetical protein